MKNGGGMTNIQLGRQSSKRESRINGRRSYVAYKGGGEASVRMKRQAYRELKKEVGVKERDGH